MRSSALAVIALAWNLAACGQVTGLVHVDVAEDGKVTVYMEDETGAPVKVPNTYLQVRGVRTDLQYAGSTEPVDQFCQQLPISGPLEFRITSSFDVCPEVHVSAFIHDPPETTRSDGTKVPGAMLPVSERCTNHQTLMHARFWIPGNCEEFRSEAPSQ